MKKAMDVSPTNIVIAIILLLIVLVVFIFIFSDETGKFITDIFNFRKDIKDESGRCTNLIYGRQCGCPSDADCTPVAGDWDDCPGDCYEVRN